MADGLASSGPWEFEVDLLGTRIRTRVDDPVLARRLQHLLGDSQALPAGRDVESFEIAGADGSDWILRRNGGGIFRTDTRQRLVEHYFSILNELALDNFSGLAVHAGVVAQGRCAIAFPGPSGAGKSTLVAACVAAGFDYVSDEALCINLSGDLVPYPRPLMLSEASRRVVRPTEVIPNPLPSKHAVSPADLGGRASHSPLQLTHVILADRGGALGLEAIPSSQVIPELLERSFNRHGDPAATFNLVANVARDCRAWHLGYTNAMEAAGLIRRDVPFQTTC